MWTAMVVLMVLAFLGASAGCEADLSITSPHNMEALSGSCLQIPCTFTTTVKNKKFDSTRQTFGVWFKEEKTVTHPTNVVYNTSETSTFPMEITGELKNKNCTTLFSTLNRTHTGFYFLRIINWPYRATAICDPLHVIVKEIPWEPRLEIPAGLEEKQSVTITCSALTPCPSSPPKLTWTLKKDSNNMEENQSMTKIQTTITLTDEHDGYSISCSASYPVNEGKHLTAEETKTLSVSYAPKDTSVSVSAPDSLSAGVNVTLKCSSRAKPPVSSFTWYKTNKEGPVKVHEGEIYSFNLTEEGVYYCMSRNDHGNQTSSMIYLRFAEASFVLGLALFWIIVIIIICLAVFLWWFKSKRRTPQQNQVQTDQEETIHYGEIDFSARRPELLYDTVQDRGQGEDTMYAEVRVSTPVSSTWTAATPEDLYAQVKKK